MKPKRVTIIGAGIGGLCTAIGLTRRGFDVQIYEQAAAFGTVGAGLTLWSNAIIALDRLGIEEEALNGLRFRCADILDSQGQVLFSTPMEQINRELGAPTLAIHRADLHRALLAKLPGDIIHTGATCAAIEQDAEGVTARFQDGTEARADLLIGADGIHSTTRRTIFPQVKTRYSGYIAWRGIANFQSAMTDRTTEAGRTSEAWGPGARFGIVPLGGGQVYWFATANLPAGLKPSPAERKANLRERFAAWHAPVIDLIEATPEDKILYNDIIDIPPMIHWSRGRVTILGDAAHATTPNLGQGACQAIESAVSLSRSLVEEDSVESAFRRYKAERHARTAWITNRSWTMGKVAQIENGLLCSLRNAVLRATPAPVMLKEMMTAARFE
jgi:2-polyprenyl-6-methoxyphenol hydroxylase-like FAD-dependent oxidoreductase